MGKMSKNWETPQLIILARGTPEESVLINCKSNNKKVNIAGPNQTTDVQDCSSRDPGSGNCAPCNSRGLSVS